MPSMPRFDKKATKIAYAILGKPANLQRTATKKQKEINEQLYRQDSMRIK